MIGEGASRDEPLERGFHCFDLFVLPDTIKEGIESFTLSLDSNDSCVWLGRDRALANIQANGGKKDSII